MTLDHWRIKSFKIKSNSYHRTVISFLKMDLPPSKQLKYNNGDALYYRNIKLMRDGDIFSLDRKRAQVLDLSKIKVEDLLGHRLECISSKEVYDLRYLNNKEQLQVKPSSITTNEFMEMLVDFVKVELTYDTPYLLDLTSEDLLYDHFMPGTEVKDIERFINTVLADMLKETIMCFSKELNLNQFNQPIWSVESHCGSIVLKIYPDWRIMDHMTQEEEAAALLEEYG